jgi:hypothetical protein
VLQVSAARSGGYVGGVAFDAIVVEARGIIGPPGTVARREVREAEVAFLIAKPVRVDLERGSIGDAWPSWSATHRRLFPAASA